MHEHSGGYISRLLVHFTDDTASALFTFRKDLREMETNTDGMMTAFLGKQAGLSAAN